MAKLAQHCWDTRWERGEKFDSTIQGRQAHTFLARRIGEDSYTYVLKELARQNDERARRRMHIEVAALETLADCDGVPQVCDSNASQFKDPVDLYLVCERIAGIDLQQLIADKGPLPAEEARLIISTLLRRLEACHNLGVVHRDIKPCHIVLHDGRLDDPYLLDFGLAFNEETDADNRVTNLGEHVGNRFIIVPEQTGLTSRQPDQIMDITQVMGVLFFLVTGADPGIIRNDKGLKPHEQLPLDRFPQLNANDVTVLNRIFGAAFEWEPDRRWQRIPDILAELESPSSATKLDDRLNDLRSLADRSGEFELGDEMEKANQCLTQSVNSIVEGLSKIFPEVQIGSHMSSGQVFKGLRWSIGYQMYGEKLLNRVALTITCGRYNELIKLEIERNLTSHDQRQPRARSEIKIELPLRDPARDTQLNETIQKAFLDAARSLFDSSAA